MSIGLGLDTGGTYTDGVIYQFQNRQIMQKAKALTRKDDLKAGILEVLDQMSPDLLARAELVSLSTTLATNACVEGKGCRAKLVLIGFDRRIIERYGSETGLPEAAQILFIEGGHLQSGQAAREPDWSVLTKAVNTQDHQTEAYAVVELWGVRNPAFENKARDVIRGLSDKPVVCGHEITGELNSLKRAASALLNARLLPLISEFLDAIKHSLEERKIQAPIVIVRGDGSLMSESFARLKPVETLLCGPAASIAGGMNLTSQKDAVIVDMGGTTSDLALVRDGHPQLAVGGARVGAFQTGIYSVHIHTAGLGGDSMIRHSKNTVLTIGPRRAVPLSWAAWRWPAVIDRLQVIKSSEQQHTQPLAEILFLVKTPDLTYLSDEEKRLCEALADGPLDIAVLAARSKTSIYSLPADRLEKQGLLMRSALTPTDIMHIDGGYKPWSTKAALLAADIMAFQIGVSRRQLIRHVKDMIRESLYLHIIEMMLASEYSDLKPCFQPDDTFHKMARKSFSETASAEIGLKMDDFDLPRKPDDSLQFLTARPKLHVPLIGIGAPVHLYLPDVAAALETECIIPEHAEVANAVGAITSHIKVEETVLIKPVYSPGGITGYQAYAADSSQSFTSYDLALTWAKEEAYKQARLTAKRRGAKKISVEVETDRREAPYRIADLDDTEGNASDDSQSQDSQKDDAITKSSLIFLETIVRASASGPARES